MKDSDTPKKELSLGKLLLKSSLIALGIASIMLLFTFAIVTIFF